MSNIKYSHKAIFLILTLIACINTSIIFITPYITSFMITHSFCGEQNIGLAGLLCIPIFLTNLAVVAGFCFALEIYFITKIKLKLLGWITTGSILLSLNFIFLFTFLKPADWGTINNFVSISLLVLVNLLMGYISLYIFNHRILLSTLLVILGVLSLDIACIPFIKVMNIHNKYWHITHNAFPIYAPVGYGRIISNVSTPQAVPYDESGGYSTGIDFIIHTDHDDYIEEFPVTDTNPIDNCHFLQKILINSDFGNNCSIYKIINGVTVYQYAGLFIIRGKTLIESDASDATEADFLVNFRPVDGKQFYSLVQGNSN